MNAERPQVAVITGGHSFDVINFHKLLRAIEGMDFYVQHMDDFASSSQAVRDSYDVLLCYMMLRELPSDEGLPWYAGKPLTALANLGTPTQGILVWHHALVAYRQWAPWRALVGLPDLRSTFHKNQQLQIQIADSQHPITQGLADWTLEDETYVMAEPAAAENHPLLTVDHPNSMKVLAWTRHYRGSRVLCLQPGHDHLTWQNEQFQTVMRRGLLWCARQI